MEIRPRPVELDQFLELDDHMLNRNSITAVTASSLRLKEGDVIRKASSDEATSAASSSGRGKGGGVSAAKTGGKKKGKKINMEIPRIVVS